MDAISGLINERPPLFKGAGRRCSAIFVRFVSIESNDVVHRVLRIILLIAFKVPGGGHKPCMRGLELMQVKC